MTLLCSAKNKFIFQYIWFVLKNPFLKAVENSKTTIDSQALAQHKHSKAVQKMILLSKHFKVEVTS